MKKVDPTVKKETVYIASVCFILSLALQSVFLIIGKWDLSVLLGNLLGYLASVGNFFLIGLMVQDLLGKEEKDTKKAIKASKSFRFAMLFLIAAIGYLLPIFNTVAVIVPYLFPRFAISLRPLIKR